MPLKNVKGTSGGHFGPQGFWFSSSFFSSIKKSPCQNLFLLPFFATLAEKGCRTNQVWLLSRLFAKVQPKNISVTERFFDKSIDK